MNYIIGKNLTEKKEKRMIRIFILAAFCFSPGLVLANTSWALRQEQDTFSVQGECSTAEVRVELFKGAKDEKPAYMKKVACDKGEFFISSDSLKKDIPTGNYFIAVDGQMNPSPLSIIKGEGDKPEMSAPSAAAPTAVDPDAGFLNAFVSAQQSILDMRGWLEKTSYPAFIKKSLDAALDGLNIAAAKISDIVLAAAGTDQKKDMSASSENQTKDMTASSESVSQDAVSDLSAAPNNVTVDIPGEGLSVSNQSFEEAGDKISDSSANNDPIVQTGNQTSDN